MGRNRGGARASQASANAPGGTSGGGPGIGRDLTADTNLLSDLMVVKGYDGFDLDFYRSEAGKNAEYDRVAGIAARSGFGPGHGRLDGALLARRQGFDGLPQLVSKTALDKAVSQGAIELFRGVPTPAFREALQSGVHFSGTGIHGNGMYSSTVRSRAEHYGLLTRMALRPGARVGDHDQLLRDARSAKLDVGNYAAMKGYDALRLGASADYVILNRTALIMQREPA